MDTGPRPEKRSAIASLSMTALCQQPSVLSWRKRRSATNFPGNIATGREILPLLLKGSCRCGSVHFEVQSHTPVPFMLCYCSICRKQQGGGGYAINLGADSATLKITGKRNLGLYRAEIEDDE